MRLFWGRPRAGIERALGHRFRRPELLQRALTHRSYANEKGLDRNNERLEFLGDAVLGVISVEWLYSGHPEVSEGELSKLNAWLVSEPVLAEHARRLDLGAHIKLGVGEARSGGCEKRSILSDAMEAAIGAVYLDGGLEAARRVVVPMLVEALPETGADRLADAKSRLQEAVQARGWELPRYDLVAEEGPDHSKKFVVECRVRGAVAGVGSGRSKKEAERRAAAEALERLQPMNAPPQ